MKCSGQEWGDFWGDWKKKGGRGDHVWNSNESTVIWESQADWHLPRTCFWEQAPSLKKVTKLPLIFILTFNQIFFLLEFFMVSSLSTSPTPVPSCQRRQRFSVFAKDQQTLGSIIRVLGNNDEGIPKVGCGNSRDVKFYSRSLERN